MLTIISCLPCGTSDFQVSLLPQAAPAGRAPIHRAHHAKPQRSKRRMGGGALGRRKMRSPVPRLPPDQTPFRPGLGPSKSQPLHLPLALLAFFSC